MFHLISVFLFSVFFFAFFIAAFFSSSVFAGSFYQERAQGWYWGEGFLFEEDVKQQPKNKEGNKDEKEDEKEGEKERQKERRNKKPVSSHPPLLTKEALEQFKQKNQKKKQEAIQRQIKTLQDELNTSVQQVYLSVYHNAPLQDQMKNLEKFLTLQKKHLDASSQFAEVGKLVALNNAFLDEKIKNPYNYKARKEKNRELVRLSEKASSELMKTHGLYFFFNSRCNYCRLAARAVVDFARKHHAVLFPISLDGGVLPEFPKAQRDNGIAEKYHVQTVPAVFAVNPKTNKTIKLANRPASVSELEETALLYSHFNSQLNSQLKAQPQFLNHKKSDTDNPPIRRVFRGAFK